MTETTDRPGPGNSLGGRKPAGDLCRIAMLGNHTPRQCGIATFTTHLSEAIAGAFPELDCRVLAMNDGGKRYAYPPRVCFEIAEGDLASYRRAADFLNVNGVDVISVQHEYGIYGGRAGSHLLTLLRELRMPIVTTLHTILGAPNPHQRAVMDELIRLSERIVVMSRRGADLLQEIHGAPAGKIDLIPHGIPEVRCDARSKDRLGVAGKAVILTFGLLAPDKGIEYVIDAMPAILARFPDTVYIVLGATHPHVKEEQGETYRLMLEDRALRLGVGAKIIFHNRFVSQEELNEFLAAADIYITPYLKEEQITSGTLAYAVGSGKAVISTPYIYARELLADGRGILVPWRDPQAIAREVLGLLGDDGRRMAMRQKAAEHGRSMTWPAVAQSYLESFRRARSEQSEDLHTQFQAKTLAERPAELPEVNLEHLGLMSDATGLLQHAHYGVPRYTDGYCVDDNARALLLMTLIEEEGGSDAALTRAMASRYLAFVSFAFHPERGRFRNFMSYARVWLEEQGSEDSHGRTLWALGTVVGRSFDPGRRTLARDLFHAALPALETFTSPRAWAYALLGLHEYLRAFEGDTSLRRMVTLLADQLVNLFQRSSAPDWLWFEDRVTYCNARLPQSLIQAGAMLQRPELTELGLRSLDWLARLQTSDGYFAPIGTNGFHVRGAERAQFDQQPVDACAMVSACLTAFRVSQDERWTARANAAFRWFLGQNQLQQALYDPRSGGCRDGLHVDRVNENQGAESTLSFLMALVEMRQLERPLPATGAVS